MNLSVKIKQEMVRAMSSGEKDKLSTLRLLVAELENEKVSNKLKDISELSDELTQAVIRRQLKKLDKEIEAYEKYGKEVSKQNEEKELLYSFLPKQMSKDMIVQFVYQALAMTEKGEIKNPMQFLSRALKGKADMSTVSQILKEVKNNK